MQSTSSSASDTVSEYLAATRRSVDNLPAKQIEALIAELEQAYVHGRTTFIIGDGGSAATASHYACDLAKTILGRPINRQATPFRVVSLADNVALITAWANDVSFDDVFAEQLRNLARPDDLLVAITGSGNSPNILAAVATAKELGMRCAGLLGFDGGRVKALLDTHVLVDSDHYGHIEDMHMMLVHLTTAYFTGLVRNGARV